MTTRSLFLALLALIVLGLGLAFVSNLNVASPQDGGVACTMEAKLCPDGSYVGRTGPNCEFSACPDTPATPTPGTAGAHCGGFIRNAPTCNAGLHCQLNISNPDTGGVCVADQTGGGGSGFAEYHSGIRGSIMTGPTCPVERTPPDPQCADKPVQTNVSIYRASDQAHSIATIQSGADGTFQISLPPGAYVVMSGPYGVPYPRCADVSATVGPTGYTQVAVSCDSGIR